MDEFAASWGQLAWTQLWQVTLVIVGVWLVLRLCGRNRPHLSCALWLVVLAKCVTPPLVSSPSGIFCWLQRIEVAEKERSACAVSCVDLLPPIDDGDSVVVHVPRAAAAVPMPSLAAQDLENKNDVSDAPLPRPHWQLRSLLSLVALAWLLGSAIFAAAALWRLAICWRTLRHARQIEQPALAALVDDLRRRLSLRRKIRLLVTDSPVGPAVVGLMRPTVILPAAIVRDKSPPQLEPLIAHELVHVRRGDLW